MMIDGNATYYGNNNARIGTGQVSGNVLSSSSTSISAVAQSDLAHVTAPPPEPVNPIERVSGAWIPVVAIGVGLVLTVVWMFSSSGADRGLLRSNTGFYILLTCGAPLLIWFLISAVIAAIFTWLDTSSRKATEAMNKKNLQQYEMKRAAQQKALAVWNQLYYCHRDDIIFLPGTKYTAAPKDTISLCYTLAQQKPR